MAFQMCPASSKNTSCIFNTFIQPLPLAWSLPGRLEGGKNCNCAETQQRPKISTKSMSDQPLAHTGKLFEKLILRTIQKHTEERNLLNSSHFGFPADHIMTINV
jgi:hypothetical protein